jgi:hypothetical protein
LRAGFGGEAEYPGVSAGFSIHWRFCLTEGTSNGFQEVTIYEKHGKLDSQWLDVVIVERLIAANLA